MNAARLDDPPPAAAVRLVAARRGGGAAADGPVEHGLDAAIATWRRGAADAAFEGRSLADWMLATRVALGFDAGRAAAGDPSERPLVVTGHQPEAWHAGIAVKYLLASRLGAPAALVVDHHRADGLRVELPLVDEAGRPVVRTWRPVRLRASRPLVLAAPAEPVPPPLEEAAEEDPFAIAGPASVIAGARALERRLAEARGTASNLADQIAAAVAGGLEPRTGPLARAGATALVRTAFGRAVVRRLATDARAAAEAYAAGVRAVPEAGLRPLRVRDDVVEVPLWRLEPDGRRLAAFDWDLEPWLDAVEVGREPPFVLAPRALLLTALARLALGDVFVHGGGGGVYDRATAVWIRRWLGLPLAPMVAVTADLRFDASAFGAVAAGGGTPDAAADRAAAFVAAAHRTWHDPETPAGARGPGPVKIDLLAGVAAAPPRSRERRAAFAALHAQLAKLRGLHAGRVARANGRARGAALDVERARLAAARDWYWGLHPPAALDALDAETTRLAAQLR